MSVVIKVSNLSKRYNLGQTHTNLLSERMGNGLRSAYKRIFKNGDSGLKPDTLNLPPEGTEFWALRDVSFEVNQGEVLGIIGRNGAGKSTLLKILSRITSPTSGRVEMTGRVASLLEVGTGFHPELTGRENIFLNGAILGMTKAEIRSKFDEIVAFAEVEKFIDTPVKRYSSGMYVRLAFAVAAHLEPEILVVDEVLAVGDAAFQKKCLGKMKSIGNQGRTVLFVSHNMAAIESLCTKALLLEKGLKKEFGDPTDIIKDYMQTTHSILELNNSNFLRDGRTMQQCFIDVNTLAENNEFKKAFKIGELLIIKMVIESDAKLSTPHIRIGINDELGKRIVTVGTEFDTDIDLHVDRKTVVICKIPQLMLMPGQYSLKIALLSNHMLIDEIDLPSAFEIIETDYFRTGKLPRKTQGVFVCNSKWSVV